MKIVDSIASHSVHLNCRMCHKGYPSPGNWTPSWKGQMDIGDWTYGQTRKICTSGQNLESDMWTVMSGLVKTLIVVSVYSWQAHPLLPPHPAQVSLDNHRHNGVIVVTDVPSPDVSDPLGDLEESWILNKVPVSVTMASVAICNIPLWGMMWESRIPAIIMTMADNTFDKISS